MRILPTGYALFRAFVFLLALLPVAMFGQMSIGGHKAAYDRQGQTWLVALSEEFFGSDNTLPVVIDDATVQTLVIDGDTIRSGSSHLFRQVMGDRHYPVSITDAADVTTSGTLQFTFLPILQLQGQFGNDYSDALLLVSDPSLPATTLHSSSVKWRGGSTNTENKHKRNYKIKLNKNYSFLGMRNDDSWVLDAGQPDVFRLRNKVASDIWNDIGSRPYYADREPQARLGIDGRVVEVFVGDEYMGIYNFSENIDRKQFRLKKADKDGTVHGCLYKSTDYGIAMMYYPDMDPYDNHSDTWGSFEMEYPDTADNDSTDWSTLYDAVLFVAGSSDDDFSAHVAEYFDMPVVIDLYVFAMALNAFDNRGKNLLWAVYDKAVDKRLTVMPKDLDCTVGQRWGNTLDYEFIRPDLLMILDFNLSDRLEVLDTDHFNDTYKARYAELRQGPLSTSHLIDRYTEAFLLMKNSGALTREEQRWNGDSDVWGYDLNIEQEHAYICQWIELHMKAFDDWVFYGISGVDAIAGPAADSRRVYSLSGQQISGNAPLRPGIYLRGGKKIIVRR